MDPASLRAMNHKPRDWKPQSARAVRQGAADFFRYAGSWPGGKKT
jgi:hypothetical protein